MNGDVNMGGGTVLTIEPEHMQMLISVFVLVLVPLFDNWLYPLVALWSSPRTASDPVGRMLAGMVLCAASFLSAAVVQRGFDGSPADTVSMMWQVPQYLLMACAEVLFSITGL